MTTCQQLWYLVNNSCLDVRIAGFVEHHAGKEVVDERHEERFIFVYQLGQVHVTKDSHDGRWFAVLRHGSLHGAESSQNGQDVPQTKVVVHLRCTRSMIVSHLHNH